MCRWALVCSPAIPTSRPRRARVARMATRGGTPRWPRWRWRICSSDWTPRMRIETRARSRALQALYAWDLRGGRDLPRVAQLIWDDLGIAPEERKHAGLLLREVQEHQAELDRDITDVTTNWRLERLGVIERCVLRL